MSNMKPSASGNIVAEYQFGNTTIYIADDCCRNRSDEEVEAILDRIAAIARNGFVSDNLSNEADT